MTIKLSPKILVASLLLTATPAMAHTGTDSAAGLVAGLVHPLTGLDHLLAMLGIGCWAALQTGALQKRLPVCFTLMLLAGFVLSLNGVVMPMIEGTIALSLLLSGLLLASASRLPASAALTLTSLFALAHGQAHGLEAAAGLIFLFATGFLTSSIVLQLTGFTLTRQFSKAMPLLTSITGSGIALIGGYLLVSA